MILFEYTIDFGQSSLNKNKYYNIYFENKAIATKVLLPYKISFNKWQSSYDIIIENDYCGSKKKINILGQTTTINFTTQPFPIINPVFTVPTTTVRLPQTTLTTSTTTALPKTIIINSISVTNCTNVNNLTVVNTLIKFDGNYSKEILLQITNIDTNIIFRKFDGGIITTSELSINLPIGFYKFEIKDARDESVPTYSINSKLRCPTPSFNIEYIPNSCGKQDAKLRIYNIKNADRFRYCVGETFNCDVLFDKPDGKLILPSTEVLIELNFGTSVDYTNGDSFTVRGFNLVETDFADIVTAITACTKSANVDIIYVKGSYTNVNLTIYETPTVISINLIKNGKKIIAPTNISISGYYTLLLNGSYYQQKYDTMIMKDFDVVYTETLIYAGTSIHDVCISSIEPASYLGTYFENLSPCS